MADSRYDWAALYGKHRDAMHRVARQVLRGSGRVILLTMPSATPWSRS